MIRAHVEAVRNINIVAVNRNVDSNRYFIFCILSLYLSLCKKMEFYIFPHMADSWTFVYWF